MTNDCTRQTGSVQNARHGERIAVHLTRYLGTGGPQLDKTRNISGWGPTLAGAAAAKLARLPAAPSPWLPRGAGPGGDWSPSAQCRVRRLFRLDNTSSCKF
jgi:hypothetical protein